MTILETERLLFRNHTLEDLAPFCALEADPVVRRLRSGRRALPPGSGLRGDPGPGPRLPEAVRDPGRFPSPGPPVAA